MRHKTPSKQSDCIQMKYIFNKAVNDSNITNKLYCYRNNNQYIHIKQYKECREPINLSQFEGHEMSENGGENLGRMNFFLFRIPYECSGSKL